MHYAICIMHSNWHIASQMHRLSSSFSFTFISRIQSFWELELLCSLAPIHISFRFPAARGLGTVYKVGMILLDVASTAITGVHLPMGVLNDAPRVSHLNFELDCYLSF